MATYSFREVLVWYGSVGSGLRVLRDSPVTVSRVDTGAVLYNLTTDGQGVVTFTTTDLPTVLITSPGGLSQKVTSDDAISAAITASGANDTAVASLLSNTSSASNAAAKAAVTTAINTTGSNVRTATDALYSRKSLDHIFVHPRFGRYWYAALTSSSKPTVAVVGDSIAKKFNASSVANSWVGKLRGQLQTTYGDGGLGFVGMADAGSASTQFLSGFWTQYGTDDKVALTGTWTLSTWKSAGPGFTLGSTTVAASTASFRVRGSTINVFFLGVTSAGGTFSVAVDGGTATNYTAGTKATNAIIKQQVATGLSTGWHTVVVNLVSGGLNLGGVSGENATGLVLNNFSRGGATTLAAIDTEASVEGAAPWNGGSKYPCDLLIYALGVNDAGTSVQGTLAATAELNARKLLNAVRESNATNGGATDVLFVLNHVGDVATRDPSMGYHDIVARWHDLARTYNGAVVDMWSKYDQNYARAAASSYWGDTATIGISGTETLHPGDTGHQAIYDMVRQVVIP